jgi:hypothetical protein
VRRAGQHSLCWTSGALRGRARSLLELHWCHIAQGRVQPALVIGVIDEARKVSDDLVEGLLVAQINLLALARLYKALGPLVVEGLITASANRADQPMRCKFAAI